MRWKARTSPSSPLDLLTDAIPDDCDLLIVNTPQQDFAAAGSLVDEMSALRAYLKNGGRRCSPPTAITPPPTSTP